MKGIKDNILSDIDYNQEDLNYKSQFIPDNTHSYFSKFTTAELD